MSGRSWLLSLLIAFLPGAGAQALGLGDIRVESALNQPLAAEIDIVGATPEELRKLAATVAGRDAFLRTGADRPAFLSSVTFRVVDDGTGPPRLRVRSAETFTEPFVTLLVELRWPGGRLVRDYALLLDPPATEAPAAHLTRPDAPPALANPRPGTPPEPAPAVSPRLERPVAARAAARATPRPVAPASRAPDAPDTYTVRARDTLSGIARRLGARGRGARESLADTIYRANPSAFAGDPNHLQRGAVLVLPARPRAAPSAPGIQPASVQSPIDAPLAATAATPAARAADEAANNALAQRLQELEQALADTRQAQAAEHAEHAELVALREQLSEAADAARIRQESDASPVAGVEPTTAPASHRSSALRWKLLAAAAAIVILALLLLKRLRGQPQASEWTNPLPESDRVEEPFAALASAATSPPGRDGLWMKPTPARPPVPAPAANVAEAEESTGTEPNLPSADPADYGPDTSYLSAIEEEAIAIEMAAAITPPVAAHVPEVDEPTVEAPWLLRTEDSGVSPDLSILEPDYMSADVELTSRRYDHVSDNAPRTNGTNALKDALRIAIEHEPDRMDLRLKLLEVHYATAVSHHLAFFELASALSRERETLTAEEQHKITVMRDAIAASAARAPGAATRDELANCA